MVQTVCRGQAASHPLLPGTSGVSLNQKQPFDFDVNRSFFQKMG
jgi:hypothetical protein